MSCKCKSLLLISMLFHTMQAYPESCVIVAQHLVTMQKRACMHVHSRLCGQVRFERSIIETPELLTDREFPSSLTLLGQPIDLTNLKVTIQAAAELA